MALGATFGGLLADRVGRRQVFAITLLVYGVATGASALSTGLAMLIVLRFVVGLGLGAELPVASTLISEFSPRRIRGRMVVLLEACWAVGWVAAAVVGTFLVAQTDNGWRWALLIGMVPAAYALYVRWGLPESVRFLESRGRHRQAEDVVRGFELEVPAAELERIDATARRLPAAPVDAGVTGETSIWSPALRRRTLAFWIVWFCVSLSYYGAFTWIPSLLVADGFTMVRSFTFTLIITLAQLPGYAVAAWLIEKWGRRTTLAAFLARSAVSAALFGLASAEWAILIGGCLLSFFNLGAWGALYAIGPELYPAQIRGTGTGAAAGFGLFALSFAIAAAAAYALPEQRGRVLDA